MGHKITADYPWVLIGIGFSVLFWVLESAMHVFVFHDGTLITQILAPATHEIWMRLLGASILIIFSVYTQIIITGRKRAEGEVRQKRGDLVIINKLNSAVNRGAGLEEIIKLLCEETKGTFSSTGATVYLLSEDRKHLVLQKNMIPSGMVRSIEKLTGLKIPSESRIPLKAGSTYCKLLEGRKPYLTNDPAEVQKMMTEFTESKTLRPFYPRILKLLKFNSVMSAPLVSDGEVIGLMDVSRSEPFTESDLRRFSLLSEHVTAILKRKKAEEALQESEEKYRDIFENVGDMICIIDEKSKVIAANKRVEEVLGYSKEELSQMHLKDLVGPGSLRTLEKVRERMGAEGRVVGIEIELISKSGNSSFGELHCTAKYKGDTLEQVRCIIIDITERKHAEEEMTKKLMKYRIERGRVYLVKEKKLDLSVDIFLDLLSSGWRGAAISRNPPQILKEACSEKTPLLDLGEGDGMFSPNIPELKTAIEDELFEIDVVLLDRLDYLITKNGFEAVLKFLQKLSELFYTEKRVLLLSLDPATLDTRELAILEKETAPPAPKHHLAIPHDLYSVLKFVYSENRGGKMPSYREIGSNFGITKPTTRKRIGELRSRGYLMELKRGRSKVLELTEKGKELF